MSESGRNNEWRGLVSGWGEWVKGIRNRGEWKKNLKVSGEYDKVCTLFNLSNFKTFHDFFNDLFKFSMTFGLTFTFKYFQNFTCSRVVFGSNSVQKTQTLVSAKMCVIS